MSHKHCSCVYNAIENEKGSRIHSLSEIRTLVEAVRKLLNNCDKICDEEIELESAIEPFKDLK